MIEYIPLYYTFHSRIITRSEKISWMIIYPLFLFLLSFYFKLSTELFILSFFSIISVYEVGYLFNDFVTVRKEKNPTMRSGGFSSKFYLNFNRHILIRIMINLTLSIIIYVITNDLSIFYVSVFILIAYYLHNTIRNRFNVLSYFSLVSLRYIGPIILIDKTFVFVFVLFIFPFCRTIEHACKKKYKFVYIKRIVSEPDFFRVKYYFYLLLCVVFFCVFYNVNFIYIIFSLYFLIYRFVCYKFGHMTKRNKHASY